MKISASIGLIALSFLSASAFAANPKVACVDSAKKYFDANHPTVDGLKMLAWSVKLCAKGGSVACVAETKRYFDANHPTVDGMQMLEWAVDLCAKP